MKLKEYFSNEVTFELRLLIFLYSLLFRLPFCSLVEEVNVLGQSLDELLHQYSTVENKLKDLHDTQMALEKEIELKTETIHLNQVGCIPERTYYPSAVRLQGY